MRMRWTCPPSAPLAGGGCEGGREARQEGVAPGLWSPAVGHDLTVGRLLWRHVTQDLVRGV
jgi:hypothetical protein